MRRGNGQGFTLIELLVTVTVLSIAVALVIPSLSQTEVIRVQSAVRTIASDIAQAQTEAMAYQTRRGLFFGAVPTDETGTSFESGNGYVVVEPTGTSLDIGDLDDYMLFLPENPSEPYVRDFRDGPRYGSAVIEEAEFDGLPFLAFDELGGPLKTLTGTEPGSGGSILVTAEQFNIAYLVTVEAMTGRVDINLVEEEEAGVSSGGGGEMGGGGLGEELE